MRIEPELCKFRLGPAASLRYGLVMSHHSRPARSVVSSQFTNGECCCNSICDHFDNAPPPLLPFAPAARSPPHSSPR